MKKVLITGANSGIGFHTAKKLAEEGNRITMLCRNREKAEQAKKQIMDQTGSRDIDILIGDLSLQRNIHKIAKEFKSLNEKLDLLINNAGIIAGERQTTPEGHEKTLAVNHLAPFLLTHLMLDLLKNADGARIVNVASEAHKGGTFDPDNIQLTDGYNGLKAYANTKLYNIMFTRELADRVKGTGITTYALHPGTVRTNLDSGGGGGSLFTFLFKIAKPFMMSPKKGARTSVYLATEPGIESLSGKYFVNKKVAKPLDIAHEKEKCRQLWELSESLTIKRPGSEGFENSPGVQRQN